MTPDELLARLLYRDGLMLIIDKPAGLAVHPGPGGGDHLERYFDALRFGLPHPPALAHRLDRDTSGCLILGRHRKALAKLGRLFSSGRIEKTYWAVVEGRPPTDHGTIDAPLLKKNQKTGWHMKVSPDGQKAVTNYRVLGAKGGRAWLELKPRTGRTHQIRVHCAHLGCPIVGDPVYGKGGRNAPLLLHARELIIPLYPNRDPIRVTAPPPAHMQEPLRACGWPGEE